MCGTYAFPVRSYDCACVRAYVRTYIRTFVHVDVPCNNNSLAECCPQVLANRDMGKRGTTAKYLELARAGELIRNTERPRPVESTKDVVRAKDKTLAVPKPRKRKRDAAAAVDKPGASHFRRKRNPMSKKRTKFR